MSKDQQDEEIRSVLEAVQLHAADGAESGDEDKLVLTPALRVEGAEQVDAVGGSEPDEEAKEIAEKLIQNADTEDVLQLDDPAQDTIDETNTVEDLAETETEIVDGEEAGAAEAIQDDAASEQDETGSTDELEPEPQSEAEPEETAQDVAPADEPATETGNAPDDEVVLDEDTLRIIVQEIVRQELQGEMGQKIAQSVRDTVRKELVEALLKPSES